MKNIFQWITLAIVGTFIFSAFFHSCKYHSHNDDDNMLHIAYRGFEQFWHNHEKEYRIKINDLLDYRKMLADKVYSEMESKGFVEHEKRYISNEHGYYKWNYKSQSTDLSKYEIAYAEFGDTTMIVYTVPEKEYFVELKNQLINLGFSDDTVVKKNGVIHHYISNNLRIKILAAESTIPGGKPSQLVIAKVDEFETIFNKMQ